MSELPKQADPVCSTPELITGYFVRAKRDGRFQTIDIALLREAELHELLDKQPPEKLVNWVYALTSWIREHAV